MINIGFVDGDVLVPGSSKFLEGLGSRSATWSSQHTGPPLFHAKVLQFVRGISGVRRPALPGIHPRSRYAATFSLRLGTSRVRLLGLRPSKLKDLCFNVPLAMSYSTHACRHILTLAASIVII